VPDTLSSKIDYTILDINAGIRSVEQHCATAEEHGFAAVCVLPCYCEAASDFLRNSEVRVCSVVGFPLGANGELVKVFEAQELLNNGADEIDLVWNLSFFLDDANGDVESEVIVLRHLTHEAGAALKVIIETDMLTPDQLEEAARICSKHEVDYVKTSTGVNAGGASLEAVKHLRYILPDHIGIKASGGIRTAEAARAFIGAGAARIGTSSLLTTA
jgi:deoxyribose-phosphate aldolase